MAEAAKQAENSASERPVVVSAVGLTKVFRDFWNRPKAKAVNDIDFEVREGEVVKRRYAFPARLFGGGSRFGLAVDGQSGVCLDQDFALVRALVDDIIPVALVGQRIPDGFQDGCFSGSLRPADFDGLTVERRFADAEKVSDNDS